MSGKKRVDTKTTSLIGMKMAGSFASKSQEEMSKAGSAAAKALERIFKK